MSDQAEAQCEAQLSDAGCAGGWQICWGVLTSCWRPGNVGVTWQLGPMAAFLSPQI